MRWLTYAFLEGRPFPGSGNLPLLLSTLFNVWRRQWQPTPVLLPGKSCGQRSLVGCSPWGRWESDTTERLHFSLSCIGEGNGNPLQCSCLENPRDSGAWWAAVCVVAQSRTRLKWLSSSSIPTYVRWRVLPSSSLVTEILWLLERFLRCCLSSSAKISLRFKNFPASDACQDILLNWAFLME